MQFMMLMIPGGYESAEPGTMPEAAAVDAMMRYNDELQKAGILRGLNGLHPPSMGARVSFATGAPVVTEGPFAEAKEGRGGYWIIEAATLQEAVAWAKKCPAGANETIEIRQIMGEEDFSDDVRDVVAKYPDVM